MIIVIIFGNPEATKKVKISILTGIRQEVLIIIQYLKNVKTLQKISNFIEEYY